MFSVHVFYVIVSEGRFQWSQRGSPVGLYIYIYIYLCVRQFGPGGPRTNVTGSFRFSTMTSTCKHNRLIQVQYDDVNVQT